MKRMQFTIVGLLFVGVLLSACGDALPAATPVPAATPTTVVKAQPTDTSEPPATEVGQEPTPRPEATSTTAVEPTMAQDTGGITYDEIQEQHEKLTDAQWPAYEATLVGQPYTDQGVIYDVQKETFVINNPRIQLDLNRDKDSEFIETYEVIAFISPEGADKLNKQQPVKVSGTIEKLECIVYCKPQLKDATYELMGDTLPEKQYPKVDNLEFPTLAEKRKELTELQWDLYVASIKGAKMSGDGFVYDVTKSFRNDNFDLKVGFEDPGEAFATYDVVFEIPAEGAAEISKGDQVAFEGMVKEIEYCIIETCNVVLENGTYTKK
jgi:hypothetical protein